MEENRKESKESRNGPPPEKITEVTAGETDNKLLDKDVQSSLLMEFSIIATIAGLFIGPGNITTFPMNVLEHGGIWFVVAHVFLVFFLGFPIVFFELLIGQITRKGTVAVYGTYCKAAKGIGVTLFLISLIVIPVWLNTDIDTPGINMQIIISAITKGRPEPLYCGSKWNTKNCISMYESSQSCARFNSSSPQFAFVEGVCEYVINDRIYTDSMQEFADYVTSNPEAGFNIIHFLSTTFILVFPLVLVFFNVKYTFYIYGFIFFVYFTLYLINLLLIATMIKDFEHAFGYIWHRTNYASLVNPKAFNALVSGVLWTLSLMGAVAPIGSFLQPNDRTFRIILTPVLLDLIVSIFSVGMIAGSLSSLVDRSPASEYLYSSVVDGTHGLILYTQLLFTYVDSVSWVALFSISKLIGFIAKTGIAVLGFASFFRDHVNNEGWRRYAFILGYILFAILITMIASFPAANQIWQDINAIPVQKAICKLLYLAGFIVCISVYGEIDFFIDVGGIYEIREDWRRLFSPIGPIMFFCWQTFIPIILLLSQSFVFVRSLYECRIHRLAAVIPVIVFFVTPIWAMILIVKEIRNGKPVLDVFRPAEDHPSYKRITANI